MTREAQKVTKIKRSRNRSRKIVRVKIRSEEEAENSESSLNNLEEKKLPCKQYAMRLYRDS